MSLCELNARFVSDFSKGSAARRRPPRPGAMTAEDWELLRREIIETFTPGTPINESDLFTGRAITLRELQDTVLEKGRHAIIFGDRGVGKTSVANIFYRPINTETRPIAAIRFNGDSATDFDSLWRKVFRRIKHTSDGQDWWADEAHPGKISPDDVVIALGSFQTVQVPIISLDEFDKIIDQPCRALEADPERSRNGSLILFKWLRDFSGCDSLVFAKTLRSTAWPGLKSRARSISAIICATQATRPTMSGR